MSLSQMWNGMVVKLIGTKIFRIVYYTVHSLLNWFCGVALASFLLLYDCFCKLNRFRDSLYWSYKDLVSAPRNNDPSLNLFLQDRRKTLKKLPDHIVVILGPEKPCYQDLAKIISWCDPLGISYISFYDHKNSVDPLLVFEAVKRSSKHVIHKIKWGKSFSEDIKHLSVKQINGYRWEGRLRINILSGKDSNQELLEAAKDLHFQLSQEGGSQPVDQKRLSQAMDLRLGAPPPDLALVCGPVLSYFACTPWHLRLTQFIHIHSHHNLKVSKFLNCLHQYSQCEQRYGK